MTSPVLPIDIDLRQHCTYVEWEGKMYLALAKEGTIVEKQSEASTFTYVANFSQCTLQFLAKD